MASCVVARPALGRRDCFRFYRHFLVGEYQLPVLVPIVRWVYPAISSEHLEAIHLSVRKSAHFAEYFIFYVLLYRGIRGRRSGWRWSWGLTAWIIAAAYSVLDEIHQSFVASRTASPWDSLLDSTGALVALLCVLLFVRFMRLEPAK